MHDDDPVALHSYLVSRLSGRGIAYVQASDYGQYYSYDFDPIALVRENISGMLVANGGFNLDRANAVLAEGKADAT